MFMYTGHVRACCARMNGHALVFIILVPNTSSSDRVEKVKCNQEGLGSGFCHIMRDFQVLPGQLSVNVALMCACVTHCHEAGFWPNAVPGNILLGLGSPSIIHYMCLVREM